MSTPNRDRAKKLLAKIKPKALGLEVDSAAATIWLDGVVGSDFTAAEVRKALSEFGRRKVTIAISSPGGDVADGAAMFEILRDHPGGIVTVAYGLVASMASFIFQAGQKRIMRSTATMMLHLPWVNTSGNSEELRQKAETLDVFGKMMVDTYAKRSGKSAAEVQKILEAETYYSAAEAVKEGFADEIQGAGGNAMTTAEAREIVNAIAAKYAKVDACPARTKLKSDLAKLSIQTSRAMSGH